MSAKDPMKWVLLVSGALTCTMLYAAIAPEAALRSTFGEALAGPLASIVVRNWGVLIALLGALLIHAAFNPPVRRAAVAVAGASKLAFVGFVLAHGTAFLQGQAPVAVMIDAVTVVIFAVYLLRGAPVPTQRLRFTQET